MSNTTLKTIHGARSLRMRDVSCNQMSHMAVRLGIPPVNTVLHGGQIGHSTSQHTTTWRSDRAFHQSTHYRMAVRSCIPPVNTLPHGGQIVHSTSQHSTTWRSDRAFHQSTQYHMVVRSCIPPVNTLPHGSRVKSLCLRSCGR